MSLDDELEILEETGETEAELIDQQTELQDEEDDVDEIMGTDAMESDLEHAFDSFVTINEMDYDGYDPYEVVESEEEIEAARELNSEGYHVIDQDDLKEEEEADEIAGEVVEIEIDEDMIDAYLYDEDDNQIGFVFTDENGNENYCYYVDEDDPNLVYDNGDEDLLTYDGVQSITDDVNVIYQEGKEFASELKDTFSDISEGLGSLKKK